MTNATERAICASRPEAAKPLVGDAESAIRSSKPQDDSNAALRSLVTADARDPVHVREFGVRLDRRSIAADHLSRQDQAKPWLALC